MPTDETATIVLNTTSYNNKTQITVDGTTYSKYTTNTNNIITTLSTGTYTLYYKDT